MKLGFALPYDEAGMPVETIRQLAQSAERLGYASVWALERDIFPSTATFQKEADASARDAVRDPLTALALAATATQQIGVGLGVVNVPFHSPVALATSLAALDRLSGGRVKLGAGIGYSESECRMVTTTLQSRTPVSEFVQAFESLWSGSDGGYQGDYYFIPKGAAIQQPVQRLAPPISLVAFAPAAVLPSTALVGGYVDTAPRTLERSEVAGILSGLSDGSSCCPLPSSITMRARVVVTAESLGTERAMFHGSPSQIRSDIEVARASGVGELMFDPGAVSGDADLVWTLSTMRMIAEMALVRGEEVLAASA